MPWLVLEKKGLKCSWWTVQGSPSPIKEFWIFLMREHASHLVSECFPGLEGIIKYHRDWIKPQYMGHMAWEKFSEFSEFFIIMEIFDHLWRQKGKVFQINCIISYSFMHRFAWFLVHLCSLINPEVLPTSTMPNDHFFLLLQKSLLLDLLQKTGVLYGLDMG